jgi:pyruvate dehydrogenase E2 component (dihydrolipoamide acetyltransferase)
MAEFIVMPKLGFDMREGVLNSWLRQVGDQINKGDVIAEIESDKATLELEAQAAGTLLHLIHGPGDIVPVGANMAVVGAAGEDISGLIAGAPAAGSPAAASPAPASAAVAPAESYPPQPAAPVAATPAPVPAAEPNVEFPDGVRATPVARRVAQERGINLLQVKGAGPDGRIRKADVETFAAAGPEPVAAAVPSPTIQMVTPTPVVAGPDSEEIAASKLRQAIARRLVESKTTVPHFYVTTEIDMAPALALRKQVNETLPEESKVTVNDMIVKAAALALVDFPNLNSSFAGDKIIRHKRINVGSAVAVDNGLLTVVQKNTDSSTLSRIAADNKVMIQRARDGKIKPEDVEGGTFTISNLGVYDVDHFIAIINPPEAAILAIGSARQVPVVVDGALTVGTRMKVTLSADHRVTDGAEAARFLQRVKALLENPLRMLV